MPRALTRKCYRRKTRAAPWGSKFTAHAISEPRVAGVKILIHGTQNTATFLADWPIAYAPQAKMVPHTENTMQVAT